MARNSRYAYVQARLQARYGRRLEEERWRLLEASGDLGNYLQAARATPLKPWIAHLTPDSGIHRLERSLREDWKAYVREIGAWLPGEWSQAMDWLARIVDLPAVMHLARGRQVAPWMRDEPALSELAVEDWPTREAALAASDYARVAADVAAGAAPEAAWLAELLRRCPERPEELKALARILAPAPLPEGRRPGGAGFRHEKSAGRQRRDEAGVREQHRGEAERALSRVEPDGTTTAGDGTARPTEPMDAWRERVGAALLAAFRRGAGGVAAVFAFLGLAALDFHRLRAGLVIRAAFPDPSRRPQWA